LPIITITTINYIKSTKDVDDADELKHPLLLQANSNALYEHFEPPWDEKFFLKWTSPFQISIGDPIIVNTVCTSWKKIKPEHTIAGLINKSMLHG
jgi:hypothetical protein